MSQSHRDMGGNVDLSQASRCRCPCCCNCRCSCSCNSCLSSPKGICFCCCFCSCRCLWGRVGFSPASKSPPQSGHHSAEGRSEGSAEATDPSLLLLHLSLLVPQCADQETIFEISTDSLQKIPHPKTNILQSTLPTRSTKPCPQKHHTQAPFSPKPPTKTLLHHTKKITAAK
jgi:hypothetical protein